MRVSNLLLTVLIMMGLLISGCSQETWSSMWSCEEPEPVAVAPEPDPCDAPAMVSAMQSFPVGEPGGNAIRLEKMAPENIFANQEFDYRIKVTNLTNSTLTNVIVKDRIPENLKVHRSEPMYTMKEGIAYWNIGDLEANGTRMISITAVPMGAGAVASCAQVSYNSSLCATMNIIEPELRITKIAPTESLACDRIPIKYVVGNVGNAHACDIEITDTLPEGLMTSEGNREVKFTLNNLGPEEMQEFKVMLDASHSGSYTSSASVTSGNSGQAQSNSTTTLVSQPVLQVVTTGPQKQFLGRPMTYQITVTNSGQASANDTTVVAGLPDGIQFDGATDGGIFTHSAPGKVTWNVGTIEPNSSRQVSMTIRYNKEGVLLSEVTAKAHCAETARTTSKTSLRGIPAILTEVIDVSDPIEVGSSESYVITITNQGSTADTNIQITCLLEDNMEFISTSGPTTATVSGNTVTFAPMSALMAKEQVQWRVNVKGISQGSARFKVIVNSDQLGTRPVEETEATVFFE